MNKTLAKPKRRSRKGTILGAMLAIFGGLLLSQEATYRVYRPSTPLVIDGKIAEAAWSQAPSMELVRNSDGSPSPIRTEAKVLFDDRYIYFAFRAWDENIWSTMRERDQHLWLEEVVEVFIQADPSHPNYLELEVNPLGTMLDIYLIDVRKPIPYRSWNSQGLKWAVQVEGTVDEKPGDRAWSTEIALPLEDVVTAINLPPRDGDRWRMNLYRIEQRPQRAALAWSPTLKADFHVPERFGEIVFVDRKVP